MDNVFPSPDHVPFLHRHFDVLHFEEHRAKVPYIPFSRVPYYLFVGRKRGLNQPGSIVHDIGRPPSLRVSSQGVLSWR